MYFVLQGIRDKIDTFKAVKQHTTTHARVHTRHTHTSTIHKHNNVTDSSVRRDLQSLYDS